MNYSFDFASVFRNFGPLWDGLWITVQLTIAANAIGLTLGFLLASLLVMSHWALIRLPIMLFVRRRSSRSSGSSIACPCCSTSSSVRSRWASWR
ncbi:ABC-type amino acid transport system permease subunit [Rhizobium giardinii]|uniref:ABC-type amino acid transport system permease subunit n=1 Tax=Rhizobium giardinii TaxID=56731 RepID=A0A7W8UA92_9HYPH|nr:ABC-type amino acid transport system permease subunit [Rhizobium giardinii]